MSDSQRPPAVHAARPAYAVLAVLFAVTLLLGLALVKPSGSSFPRRPAPLAAPHVPDVPVIRHYK